MTTIVVLGMHRSGTSCVAHALHQAGVYLGDNLMNHVASDNLEGHWESKDALEINDAILAASGADWHQVPADLTLTPPPECESRIARFLEQLATQPIHGFKDPRTLITYPCWEPHLRNVKIVACLRHPHNVATSLARRVIDWNWEQGLELWLRYNERLLHYTSIADPESVFWFDFDAEPAAAELTLRAITDALGLKTSDAPFNSVLRHHAEQTQILDPRVAEMYASLREESQAWQAKFVARRQACAATNAAQEWRQLQTVNSRHDELLQRHQASLWSLESALSEAGSGHKELREQAAVFRQQVQEHHERIDVWRQSLVARCEEALVRSESLQVALQAEAQTRSTQQEALESRALQAAQGLTYLNELMLEQHAVNVTACRQLQDRSDQLAQQTRKLGQQNELLAQQNDLLAQQNELLSQRIAWLEQRLFWPMVARKARSAWTRIKRSLQPPYLVASRT